MYIQYNLKSKDIERGETSQGNCVTSILFDTRQGDSPWMEAINHKVA
jgi:hypothetical protein